jgi:delta(3,5)-delta(2,4)-dienoyl-CoA isomerase
MRQAIILFEFLFHHHLLQCPKPVIGAIHNACIGGAVDLITAVDIRYCTTDAWFQVKEVDAGRWK